MKILISGSREYRKLEYVDNFLSCLEPDDLVIVGDARGVDTTVSLNWHNNDRGYFNNFKLKVFPADWDTHGNKAGIVRNLEMLDQVPDLVVAFWNGESRGTRFVIDAALKRCLNLRVIFDLL